MGTSRTKAALGIDVGGTFAKVAAVAPSGRVLLMTQIPTRGPEGPGPFVKRLARVLEGWRLELPALEAVGLGLAGDVDSERGLLRFSPNLRGWEGYDFKRELARRLRLPVTVDNDANMAVWGGYQRELKGRARHVVGLTLGTGVGGGIILEGRLFRGATGSAGEVGHTRVEFPGEPCRCGSRGCLEAYAGSYGIVRTAQRLLAASRRKSLLRLEPDLDPARIARAAEEGDAVALEVWARTASYLAGGISNLVLLLNPEFLLLLGGVSRAGKWLLGPLRRRLEDQPFRTPFRRLRIRAADNPDWGCVGAALLALEEFPGR